jgi:hypothetical protein
MHLIAVNDQASDRCLGIAPVHRNAKPIAASPWSITALESLFDVMDVVLQQLYVGTGSHDAYTQWGEAMLSGAEVTNFKTLDPYVTLVVNSEYTLSSRRGEVRCVEDRRFAWIASEGNESVTRVAGYIDTDQFFVDSTPHVHGAARTRSVRGMLNGAPRRSLSAGVRIIPGRRHIVRSIGLTKGSGSAHK